VSLALPVMLLDDRPALLDFGRLKSAERLGCLLVAWHNLLSQVCELPTQCRSSNANSLWWRVLADPTGVITISQIHGPRTDS
jgi:hypothetical protein